MSKPSLSIRFAFVLSLSLASSYTSHSYSHCPSSFSLSSCSSASSPKPTTPKATPSDLLSLLGTPQQASSIDPTVAKELKSCLKFLVPFSPTRLGPDSTATTSLRRGLMSSKSIGNRSCGEVNELLWWPPESVMELARLGVDSGGDPGAIHRALDPTMIPVSVLFFRFFIIFFHIIANSLRPNLFVSILLWLLPSHV